MIAFRMNHRPIQFPLRPNLPDQQAGDGLLEKIGPKYRPAWEGKSRPEQAAMAWYYLPHKSSKALLGPSRPRVIKWYCPFADQRDFPSGHRYCINVYIGCAHACDYCYAFAYSPGRAAAKPRFDRMVQQDMADLERFDVPPAPVHLSNSTDPFQPMEADIGHTRLALEQVLIHRHRFTTVTVLTKNPLMGVGKGYLDLFRCLAEIPPSHPRRDQFLRVGGPAFCAEVTLAFWRDEARAAYEPNAPSVQDRIDGVRALRAAGVPVVLRIDPLFPRSPLGVAPAAKLPDFGLIEAQTPEDLTSLVHLAKEVGARHVVYSPLKIVQPRARPLSATMFAIRRVYERLVWPERLVFRGAAWRLPPGIANSRIVSPFLDICRSEGVSAKHCKQNLLETP